MAKKYGSDVLEAFPALYLIEKQGQYLFRDVDEDGLSTFKHLNAADVAAAFAGHSWDTAWLPPAIARVFYHNGSGFVCYHPPAQVKISVVRAGASQSLTIPAPGTILLVKPDERKAYLWATDLDIRQHPDASAYRAPFPNVHNDGAICWGSAGFPHVSLEDPQAAWRAFFASSFNADLSEGKCISYPTNVLALLETLDGKRRFPAKELVFIAPVREVVERTLR